MAFTSDQLFSFGTVVVALVLSTFGLLRALFVARKDARTPIVVSQVIPLVGHLINILKFGFKHFENLAEANPCLLQE